MKTLDPIRVEVLRIALLWMVLWLCCHNNELWSAIGDTMYEDKMTQRLKDFCGAEVW